MQFQSLGKYISLIAVVLAPGLAAPLSVMAHPHNWIDVRVEVRFDTEGHAMGLYQRWLFDDYYSVYVTEGMDGDGDGVPDRTQLDELLATMLTNIKKSHYFTQVEQRDNSIAFGAPSEGGMVMQGHRLELSYFLPFESRLDLTNAPLSYRVYDPTYYIEMLHAKVDNAITLRNAPGGCRYGVERPTPDPKIVAYAATLSADESGGDTLGKSFAEKVTVECSSAS